MREKLLNKNNPYDKLNSKVGRILTQEQLTEITSENTTEQESLLISIVK